MQRVLRPWITAGVALTGASVVIVTPVAPSLPDVQERSVQLTSVGDLIDPYEELFTNTSTNLQNIAGELFANPAPFLSQVIANQTGYGETISAALQSGNLASLSDIPKDVAQNFLNAIHTLTDTSVSLDTSNLFNPDFTLPSTSAIISAITSGDFHDLIQTTLNGAIGSVDLNLGLPVALAVDSVGAPYFGINALIDSATNFSDALQAGDAETAFTTLLTAPATITDAYLNGSGVPLSDLVNDLSPFGVPSLADLESGLSFDLGTQNIPISGADLGLPASLSTIAHLNLGDVSVTGLDGNIPLGGLLAPLGHIDLGATLDYSGGGATFDPITIAGLCIFNHCLPPTIITPPAITIPADQFPISTEVGGTPIGGLIPGLLEYAPQQLANAISEPVTQSYQDIATEFQNLPNYLLDQANLTSIFGPEGFLGFLASAGGLGDIGTLLDPTAGTDLLTALGADILPNLASGLPLDLFSSIF